MEPLSFKTFYKPFGKSFLHLGPRPVWLAIDMWPALRCHWDEYGSFVELVSAWFRRQREVFGYSCTLIASGCTANRNVFVYYTSMERKVILFLRLPLWNAIFNVLIDETHRWIISNLILNNLNSTVFLLLMYSSIIHNYTWLANLWCKRPIVQRNALCNLNSWKKHWIEYQKRKYRKFY